VIVGGPCAGKSTLADSLASGHKVYGTDELMTLDWSESSLLAAQWLNEPAPWVCEGVAMGRALRKWLAANPVGFPADLIVYLKEPAKGLSGGQIAMHKACWTIWLQIKDELMSRGVPLIEF